MNISTFFTAIIICFSSVSTLAFDHDHKALDLILKEVVIDQKFTSAVKYKDLKEDPKKLLSYLEDVSRISEKEFGTWTNDQRLSYLINVYNAFTLKLIIDHYPIKSIRDVGGLLSTPWKKKFFSLFGKKANLDHIEHNLIRGKFKEPRIHFALVCASIGCPKLSSDAFIAAKLNSQLEKAAEIFLQDKNKNHFEAGANPSLKLSSIFKWYGKDFGKDDTELKRFILPKMNLSAKELAAAQNAPVSFLDYDWGLNELSNMPGVKK